MPASYEDRAEKQVRINRIARLLASGGRRSDALQMGSEKWGVSERTVDDYLKHARAKLKADFDMDRPQLLAELLSQLSTIQIEARRTGQWNVALGAVNTAARLTQLTQ